MWIWLPERADGGDPAAIVDRAQDIGLTHIFVAGSPYIDEDVVFGKRDSLVVEFEAHPPGKAVDGLALASSR